MLPIACRGGRFWVYNLFLKQKENAVQWFDGIEKIKLSSKFIFCGYFCVYTIHLRGRKWPSEELAKFTLRLKQSLADGSA